MRSYFLGLICILTASGTTLAGPPVISAGGAFVLNAPPSILTIKFSRTLSNFENEFNKVTGYDTADYLPIVVVLHDIQTDELPHSHLSVDAVEENVPKIQVDLPVKGTKLLEKDESLICTINGEISRTLAQAMLLREYYGGKAPVAGTGIAQFPEWLLHGLGRLCNPYPLPVVIPASYLQGGAPPAIEDLLIQKAPDDSHPSLLDIYDAMSATLLSAGFKAKGGSAVFQDWIGHYNPQSPKQTLSHWPSEWEMESVERRWLLLMASMSGGETSTSSLLSLDETMTQYDAALAGLPTSDHSLAALKKTKGGEFLSQQFSSRLLALRLQANPLAIPLLDQSIQLCAKFKHLSVKKIAEKEKELAVFHDGIIKRSRDIESYLDWYEAAKLPVKSGLFDNLLHTPDPPIQKGPVGHAVDAVEQRGW